MEQNTTPPPNQKMFLLLVVRCHVTNRIPFQTSVLPFPLQTTLCQSPTEKVLEEEEEEEDLCLRESEPRNKTATTRQRRNGRRCSGWKVFPRRLLECMGVCVCVCQTGKPAVRQTKLLFHCSHCVCRWCRRHTHFLEASIGTNNRSFGSVGTNVVVFCGQ